MVERFLYTEDVEGSSPSPPTKLISMAEIKNLIPSTKKRPRPESPARVIGKIEATREGGETLESPDTTSVLADALDLVREGHLSDVEIDELHTISDNEKTFLKEVSSLFEILGDQNKEIEELREIIIKLKQRLGEEQT